GDGLIELMPFLGVLQGGFIGSLGYAQGQGGNGDPPSVQYFHGLPEPFSDLSYSLAVRDPALIKDQLCGFRSPHSQFVFLFSGLESGCPFFYDEGSNIVSFPGCSGACQHHGNIAANSMGDPVLGSIQYPFVPFL